MPNIKLKWTQIIVMIAPRALEHLSEEFLLAIGRSSGKPLKNISISHNVSGSGRSILGTTKNVGSQTTDL